jgi:hypothetical protein
LLREIESGVRQMIERELQPAAILDPIQVLYWNE